LLEKKDEIFMEGSGTKNHRNRDAEAALGNEEEGGDIRNSNNRGGSSYRVLVGKRMVPAAEYYDSNNPAIVIPHESSVQERLAEADAVLSAPKQAPPPETILMDNQSYFSERPRNPWDCESVLSTYSNLDNNPAIIDASSSSVRDRQRRRRRRNQKNLQEEPSLTIAEDDDDSHMADRQRILLSSKTGLPLENKEDDDDDDDDDEAGWDLDNETSVSVNLGAARNKKETREEKRARKAWVKRQRQIARIEKKVTREMFQEEQDKRSGTNSIDTDCVAGKTVFRFA